MERIFSKLAGAFHKYAVKDKPYSEISKLEEEAVEEGFTERERKFMKRVMALDVGFKRIGVALSDPLRLTASPYKVIERRSNRETFGELLSIIKEKSVSDVVVGIPVNSEGKKTKIGEKIEKFAEKFKKFLEDEGVEVKFHFVDESYSTLEAKELMRSLGKERETVDDVAAALILKEWLERER